jgi:hypothetical protein
MGEAVRFFGFALALFLLGVNGLQAQEGNAADPIKDVAAHLQSLIRRT